MSPLLLRLALAELPLLQTALKQNPQSGTPAHTVHILVPSIVFCFANAAAVRGSVAEQRVASGMDCCLVRCSSARVRFCGMGGWVDQGEGNETKP
jgi:hypothetical protein